MDPAQQENLEYRDHFQRLTSKNETEPEKEPFFHSEDNAAQRSPLHSNNGTKRVRAIPARSGDFDFSVVSNSSLDKSRICSYRADRNETEIMCLDHESGFYSYIADGCCENTNVLIVEDVITTGKSSIECSNLVKINKANIIGYACIIDRSDGKTVINDKIISQIKLNIPTYKKENLPKELISIDPVKPGSRNL